MLILHCGLYVGSLGPLVGLQGAPSISTVPGPLILHFNHWVRTCEQWQHSWLDPDAVWCGEWGEPRHLCVRWKSTCLKGKGLFLAWFLAFLSIWACIGFNRRNDAEKCIRLVCEKLTIFPYTEYIVEFCVRLAFLWNSQVEDRSGGEEKCMCINVTQLTQHGDCRARSKAALRPPF